MQDAKSIFYVTGCDSGFGAMVVSALDGAGFGCFAGCYTPEGAARLREACSARVRPVSLDVTSEESVTAAAAQIASDLGALSRGLDGVLNNAGILMTPGPTEWTTAKSFDAMYRVNVLGTAAAQGPAFFSRP